MFFAVPALWMAHKHGWSTELDTDSAMRLVQVRDLLQGQGWFDVTQWRMNAPFGLPMHWSRLVDGPLALLIRLTGEKFALTFWPLLVLFPVLLALARIGEQLGGRMAAITALVLGLMTAEINGLFAPGNIDHHNVQLALMLWTLLFLIEQRPRLTAVMVALSLGVGLETLPYAMVAIAAGALWLWSDAKRAGDFGLALAASAAALFLSATAARFHVRPACDAYSLFYAVPLMTGGAGLFAISRLPRHKLLAFAGLVAVILALAALLNPACFAGPFGGVDARLRPILVLRNTESQTALTTAHTALTDFVAAYLYACFAFLACFFAPARRARLLVLAFAGMALVVAGFQIRASSFAILFALPGLAAALSQLRLLPLALGLALGNNVAFAAAGVLIEGSARQNLRIDRLTRQVDCGSEKAMAPLLALPQGRVAALIDQGPAVLAYTKDAVLAGPYHRNTAGILDTYAIFTGKDPRAILKSRGVDYVMTCSASPDWDSYRSKDGLAAALAAHRTPQWLAPVSRSGAVSLYRVVKN